MPLIENKSTNHFNPKSYIDSHTLQINLNQHGWDKHKTFENFRSLLSQAQCQYPKCSDIAEFISPDFSELYWTVHKNRVRQSYSFTAIQHICKHSWGDDSVKDNENFLNSRANPILEELNKLELLFIDFQIILAYCKELVELKHLHRLDLEYLEDMSHRLHAEMTKFWKFGTGKCTARQINPILSRHFYCISFGLRLDLLTIPSNKRSTLNMYLQLSSTV